MAAHVCYVLAGLHSQAYDAASQLCLVGGDHRAYPRCFATLLAMQRNEVLEWARCQGNGQLQHTPFGSPTTSHVTTHMSMSMKSSYNSLQSVSPQTSAAAVVVCPTTLCHAMHALHTFQLHYQVHCHLHCQLRNPCRHCA